MIRQVSAASPNFAVQNEYRQQLDFSGPGVPIEGDWQAYANDTVYLEGDTLAWSGLFDDIKDKALDGAGARNTWADGIPLLFTGSLLKEQDSISPSLTGAFEANVINVDYKDDAGMPLAPLASAAPVVMGGMGSSTLIRPPLLLGAGSHPSEATYTVFPSSVQHDHSCCRRIDPPVYPKSARHAGGHRDHVRVGWASSILRVGIPDAPE
jgi:hypothetical protein